MVRFTAFFLVVLPPLTLAQQGKEAGAVVYQQHCAACHDSGTVRMPPRSALQLRSSDAITRALTSGVMKQQGASLSAPERLAVAAWLGRKTAVAMGSSELRNACSSRAAAQSPKPHAEWTLWGAGLTNTRFQTAEAAGLTIAETGRLKLKWAFAVPDATYMRSQPAVYNGQIIIAGGDMIYSLDARSGCTRWATGMPAPVRSGISIANPAGTPVAFFGDQAGTVHAIDATNGKPIWQMHPDPHPAAMVTGAPVYHSGRLYVPVSSFEELSATFPGYVCCTFRGSIVALNARTGELLWQTHTINEVQKESVNKKGTKSVGPSGAGIWSAPTIDERKGVLYVTTGDNYSDPPTENSDAVLALSLDTGTVLWSKQLRTGDAFNVTCLDSEAKNCPDANGPDFDFGSPAMLVKLAGGRRMLVLSQKSGAIYGLDPDDRGKVIWQSQVGKGGVLGGVEWGVASDNERVYVALSDQAFLPTPHPTDPSVLDPEKGGGLFALRLDNGERLWMTNPPPCGMRRSCSPAQPAAVSAIPGIVFSGSLDGHIRGYSTADGKIVWDYNTVREYKAVDGVPGRGGSLDVAGPVVVNGMLYVVSGYDQFGAAPGNMLLAFSVDGR